MRFVKLALLLSMLSVLILGLIPAVSFSLGDSSLYRRWMRIGYGGSTDYIEKIKTKNFSGMQDRSLLMSFGGDSIIIDGSICPIRLLVGDTSEMLACLQAYALNGDVACAGIIYEIYVHAYLGVQHDKLMQLQIKTLLGRELFREEYYLSLIGSAPEDAAEIDYFWRELGSMIVQECEWTLWQRYLMFMALLMSPLTML